MRDPRVTAAVVGMSRPERLAEAVAFATVAIPPALWPELEEIRAGIEGLPPGQ
jgi:D-threo-aldose 1-dehydrogenase